MCEDNPISSQTTTQSGNRVNIEIIEGMINIGDSFECGECHQNINQLTIDYRCPYCGHYYENYLF